MHNVDRIHVLDNVVSAVDSLLTEHVFLLCTKTT